MNDTDRYGALHSYQPCLRDVGDHWRERWVLLREFIRNWFWTFEDNRLLRREIHDVETWGEAVASVEERIGIELPPSLREWVSLFEQTNSEYYNLLRDDYAMLWSDNDQTLVIQVICEGNVAWGVKRSDLHLPDPPVQEMDFLTHGDDDETWRGTQWTARGAIKPTVTEFMMKQILDYLPGKTWINVSLPEETEPRQRLLVEMGDFFDSVSTFGEYRLYESTDILAGLRPSARMVQVHFRKELPVPDRLPAWIRQNTRNSRYRI